MDSSEETVKCGVCKSEDTAQHCDNDQCNWHKCQVKKCGAFGHDKNWVVTKK